MTPTQFESRMRRIANAFPVEAKRAEAKATDETKTMFVRESSGAVPTNILRLIGHPYAVRNPGNLDPAFINAQSGKLRASWKKTGPRARGGGLVSSVVNTDPIAKFMFGTSRMVARRIDQAVAFKMWMRRLILHRLAIRRALRA